MNSNEWMKIEAQEFCIKVTDGTHDSPKRREEGRFLITSKHIKGRNIDFENAYRISEEDYEKINERSKVDQWDVLISMIGEYCGFCYIEREKTVNYSVKNVGIFKTGNKLKAEWLYYYLLSDEGKHILSTLRSGTSQPYISLGALRKLPIRIPVSETYMRSIVNTLICLDDKIELNNRINKNLEEMARTIFKSWFVDFEAFQDSEFEDNELGRIPKGWKIDNLDNIANYLNGLAMQKHRPETDKFLPVIKIKELNQGFSDDSSDKASVNIPEQYIIQDGDVIFSWSGTLMVKIWTGGIGGLNQHLFKVTSDKYEKWFLYLWTLKHLERFQAIARDKATTMGHIKRSHLTESKVLIPTDSEMKTISNMLKPIFTHMTGINIQNRNLKDIRDSLLPKLMSGEIRAPVEEVK